MLAMVLLLVGFAFKVSAVPFHMWTPDAYQGAPTLVTGFMSTGVKAAAFAAFVARLPHGVRAVPRRMAADPLGDCRPDDDPGHGRGRGADEREAHARVFEHRARRLPAASAWSPRARPARRAILFYLVAYAVTNLGAFGVLAALSTNDRPHDDIRDFAGLWNERPGLAALLTVFLLSLGGFPPTVGFIAKWYIFNAAVQENLIALAVLGVLTSVVSVFFYLRIVVMMYMTDEQRARPSSRARRKSLLAGMLLALAAVFYLGLLPGPLLTIARNSVAAFF